MGARSGRSNPRHRQWVIVVHHCRGGRGTGERHNLANLLRRDPRRGAGTGRVGQALCHREFRQRDVPQRGPAITPQPHAFAAQTDLLHDLDIRRSLCGGEHDARTHDDLLGGRVTPDEACQTRPFGLGHGNRCGGHWLLRWCGVVRAPLHRTFLLSAYSANLFQPRCTSPSGVLVSRSTTVATRSGVAVPTKGGRGASLVTSTSTKPCQISASRAASPPSPMTFGSGIVG